MVVSGSESVKKNGPGRGKKKKQRKKGKGGKKNNKNKIFKLYKINKRNQIQSDLKYKNKIILKNV